MSVVSVEARSFILALFIRDDGERFLLGDNGYDFIDSQLHFTANAIENDEVQKQGTDGVLVAGQVRRASVQTFDGYIGDATTPKSKIEQMRRDFFAFFAKGHHFRVIYVDCNRDAWQRKGGYLVDAPEVKELWQIHPEYHVGLNFEDVNYYEYDENAEGEEILANVLSVPISSEIEGGLEWDEDGAISVLPYGSAKTATGNPISIADAVEAPLKSLEIQGETTQQTYTGKNLLNTRGTIGADSLTGSGVSYTINADGTISTSGSNSGAYKSIRFLLTLPAGTYKFSGCPSGGTNNGYSFCVEPRGDSTLQLFDTGNGNEFTLTEQKTIRAYPVRIGADTGVNMNGKVFKPMITVSTAEQTYEPYVGGVPAPNPDYPQAVQTVTGEQTITINSTDYKVNLGKNLFNKNDSTRLVEGYLGSEKFYTASNYWTYYIPCEPNTTYTASRTITAAGRFAMAWVENTSTFPANSSSIKDYVQNNSAASLTITTGANAKYVAVWFYNANQAAGYTYDEWASAQQCEKGSTATSYAPYFTPIELCKIGTYQDYIYKDGTDWKIRKAVHKLGLNSQQNWLKNTIGSLDRFYVFHLLPERAPSDKTVALIMSDYFVSISQNSSDAAAEGISALNYDGVMVNVESGTFADASAFNTWLDAKGVSIYYALATPTDTTITNAALIAQLEATLAGGTQDGTNTITLTPSAGATGALEVEYYSAYQDGGYVWEEGGSGGPTTVVNESISAVYPVWTVYGPAQNPILENTTNNTSIEYVGMVADGQTLVIDMGAQTASLDGLNVLSALTGDFIQLEAGSNILLYSASNDAPASEIGWSEIVG